MTAPARPPAAAGTASGQDRHGVGASAARPDGTLKVTGEFAFSSDLWLAGRQPAYRTFILANARSLWDNNKNAGHQFGLRWTGPFDRADAARQSSALDGLNAAVAVGAG